MRVRQIGSFPPKIGVKIPEVFELPPPIRLSKESGWEGGLVGFHKVTFIS